MKYCPWILAALSVCCFARPVSDIPELAEVWKENHFVFPVVDGYPASLLSGDTSELIVAGVPDGHLSLTLFLIGDGPEGPDVLASGPYQGEYNFSKSSVSWEEDSLLTIYFQMPFSARYAGARYSWRDDELVPVEWLMGDPSLEALESIDSLLAMGLIGEAAEELEVMFYPGNYYRAGEMAMKFLRSARGHALEEYRSGDPERAVEYFSEAEEVVNNLVTGYPWYSAFDDSAAFHASVLEPYATIGEFTAIANDYGFFLEQTGRCEEAVEVLGAVLALDPARTVAYLNLADALWELGDRVNAVNSYLTYAERMERVRLEEQIPERVGRRTGE
ncbi:MAG: bacterial transcriptional activator domain-containing protein [Candidatus Aegiribacteria sp.]